MKSRISGAFVDAFERIRRGNRGGGGPGMATAHSRMQEVAHPLRIGQTFGLADHSAS
jgi:hypothetical protein